MSTKVAVIGVGAMGRNHSRVYSEMPDVELSGVADVNGAAAAAVARRAATRAYTDYRELLDEQRPQAVTVAVPIYVTGEYGMFRVDYLTQDLYFFENAMAHGDSWETQRVLRGVSEGRMIRHVVAKKEPLLVELEAYLAATRGEAPVPISGIDGLKALELAQARVVSGQEHRAISFEKQSSIEV